MYPHERSLVEKFEGEPFALLGVNSDSDREALKKTIAKKELTWRSWWDGGSTRGPIATRWNVSGWPTLYLIDHEGVIRMRDIHGDFEATIESLVAEAKIAANESAQSEE